jgi:hypothetical protein
MHKIRVGWKNNVWMVKLLVLTPYKHIRRGNVQLNLILTCALDGGELKLYAQAALPPVKKPCIHSFIYFFPVALRPNAGHGLLIHKVF